VAAFVLILAGSVLATRPIRPSSLPAGLAPADESVGGAAGR
jgi:hypothetical protein